MPAGCLLSPFQISDVSDSVRGVNTAGIRVLEISIDGNGQYGQLVCLPHSPWIEPTTKAAILLLLPRSKRFWTYFSD